MCDKQRDSPNHTRFYYESAGVFTPAQLAEIKKFSFSRLMCDSGDSFQSAPIDSFRVATVLDMVSCAQIPAIDLNVWREA